MTVDDTHAKQPTAGALLFAVLCWLAATAAGAATTAPVGVVQFGTTTIGWSEIGVPGAAATVQVDAQPSHGTITVDTAGRTLSFDPEVEFWGLGQDRFEVSWVVLGSQQATVLLVAYDSYLEPVTGFEAGDPLPAVHGDPYEVSAAGALIGERGLFREIDSTTAASSGAFDRIALGIPPGTPAGNGSSGEIVITIDPPPGGESTQPPDEGFWSFFGALAQGSAVDRVAEVRAGWVDEDVILQARWERVPAEGPLLTDPATAPVLGPGAHRVRIQASTFVDNHLRVLVDDRAVLELEPSSAYAFVDGGFDFGHLDGFPRLDHTLRIDQLKVDLGLGGAVWQLLLADDFDAGLGAWDAVVQGAGTVTAPSTGEQLEIDVVGETGWGAWVRDSAAVDAEQLTGRFTFDTSLLTMGAGDELLLLVGYGTDPPSDSHLQVRLRPAGNDFEIRADARHDSGSVAATDWQPIARGEHLVELRWRAATSNPVAGFADGYVRLYLDSAYAGEAGGLDNSARRIEALRLGAMALDDGTRGLLVIDDYVSWIPTDPNTYR